MSKELDNLLYEIEKRGNRITTFELLNLTPRISQYQRALKQLREKVVSRGWILTEAEPVLNQKRCFMYRLIKPAQQTQGILFPHNDECSAA